MTETTPSPPAKSGGTEITRFNALRHGVLSCYTVLPWEDAGEYQALVAALVAEHAPQGPTEEHLVEELAGILWRKRRLRLAEAAGDYRALLDANGMIPSMSRRGNCWDNAPMEIWFYTLKTELVHHAAYPTREAAKRDLFAYIETYYNRQRLHSALGYRTPEQMEAQAA